MQNPQYNSVDSHKRPQKYRDTLDVTSKLKKNKIKF